MHSVDGGYALTCKHSVDGEYALACKLASMAKEVGMDMGKEETQRQHRSPPWASDPLSRLHEQNAPTEQTAK